MILMPTADYSKLWQLNIYAGREEGHQLMWNLYFYAIDRKNMRYKGDTYIVHESSEIKAAKKIEVARLEYAGNWSPEPGGWWRLHNVMHNSDRIDVDTKTVKLGTGELLTGGYKIAHLTGTHHIHFDPASASEISKFVETGGTLIVDSCGGNSDFSTSAEEQLNSIFPAGKLSVLPPEHPAFAAGVKAADVTYRTYAKKVVGNLHSPRIKAIEVQNRPAVFFSAEDLSTGLVGQSIDGIFGYEPQSATDLMRSLLMFSTGGPVAKPAPPVTPATPPSTTKARPSRPRQKKNL